MLSVATEGQRLRVRRPRRLDVPTRVGGPSLSPRQRLLDRLQRIDGVFDSHPPKRGTLYRRVLYRRVPHSLLPPSLSPSPPLPLFTSQSFVQGLDFKSTRASLVERGRVQRPERWVDHAESPSWTRWDLRDPRCGVGTPFETLRSPPSTSCGEGLREPLSLEEGTRVLGHATHRTDWGTTGSWRGGRPRRLPSLRTPSSLGPDPLPCPSCTTKCKKVTGLSRSPEHQ